MSLPISDEILDHVCARINSLDVVTRDDLKAAFNTYQPKLAIIIPIEAINTFVVKDSIATVYADQSLIVKSQIGKYDELIIHLQFRSIKLTSVQIDLICSLLGINRLAAIEYSDKSIYNIYRLAREVKHFTDAEFCRINHFNGVVAQEFNRWINSDFEPPLDPEFISTIINTLL
jgi:hypothetical protein